MTFIEFKGLLENSKQNGVDCFFESLGRLSEVSTEGFNKPLKDNQFYIYRNIMFAYYNVLNGKGIIEFPSLFMSEIWKFIENIETISTAEYVLLEMFLQMYNSLFSKGGIYNEIQG